MSGTNDKNKSKNYSTTVSEKDVRPSVNIRMIRHAESCNNQVYRNAKYIYRGGTPEFDEAGWWHYVETHRRADPTLSDAGVQQAGLLANHLGPHLAKQASQPVHIITSPMRRTLETIRPTIDYLILQGNHDVQICVQAFYYESDGCHTKDTAEPGLAPDEITTLLQANLTGDETKAKCRIDFVGFPDPQRGWNCQATAAETRAQSEERAAKFYLWLCHTLDQELSQAQSLLAPAAAAATTTTTTAAASATASSGTTTTTHADIFDAGVSLLPGEEDEVDFDPFAPRLRRRRTYLLVGHGDFMSLVLKRVMAGYGYAIEHDGIPHRSAMVHHNTGMTELEYFGQGRFLLMQSNAVPHIPSPSLLSGGSLKDGWSFIVPTDDTVLQTVEVTTAFADELSGHVREQSQALRALYLPSSSSSNENGTLDVTAGATTTTEADNSSPVENTALTVAQENDADSSNHNGNASSQGARAAKHFVVQRGHQVVAVATYVPESGGHLTDVAVQPGVPGAREALVKAAQAHERTLKRSGSLVVMARTAADQEALVQAGFQQVQKDDQDHY